MKLKSLFLASLAAMAMVSCSNDNDPINADGGNVEKNAVLNFGIAMPASTRGVTTGGSNSGTAQESQVNDITLILNYENASTPQFKKTYDVTEFTQTGSKYELSTKELVAPGKADVVVYVNGNPTTSTIASSDAFDLGTYASTAGKGNFFMTGEHKALNIVANSAENQATVSVERVAAKIVEATEKAGFSYPITNSALTHTGDLSVTLTDYAISNLNKKSNVLKSTNTYYAAGEFWNNFVPATANAFWSDKFKAIKAMDATDKTIYCFENNNSAGAPTMVYYKAKATLEGATGNFYVHENIIYKSFKELDDAVFNKSLTPSLGLTDKSSNEDFMTKAGVMKYTDGICYYSADIKTVSGDNILRNNIYKLNVTSIKDLGLPEIDIPVPGDPTLLGLDVTVQDWTVNLNDIEL